MSWCLEGWLTGKGGEAYTCGWQCCCYFRNNSTRKLLWENLALTDGRETKCLAFQNPQKSIKWTNLQVSPCGNPFSKMPSDLAFSTLAEIDQGSSHWPSRVILAEVFRVRIQNFLFSNKISLGRPRFQDCANPGMSLHLPFLFQIERIIHIHRWTALLADTEYAIRPTWLLFHPRFYTQNTLYLQMKLINIDFLYHQAYKIQ